MMHCERGSTTKGTPQGAIMGPLVYSIFPNDLLLQLERHMKGSLLSMLMTTPCNPATVASVNSRHAVSEGVLIVWFERKYVAKCCYVPLNDVRFFS